jgi:cytidylate kinase
VAAIPARKVRRGRPLAMDEFHKGKLVGLMTYGLTFRQAAAMLGVDHKTVLNTMKRDAELAVEVADARLAAVARPLMKIIAESERSWRAATWLVKYLERRMAFAQEETPEERAERWENRDQLLKG